MLGSPFRDAVPAQYIPLVIFALFAAVSLLAAFVVLRKRGTRSETNILRTSEVEGHHSQKLTAGGLSAFAPSWLPIAAGLFLIFEAVIVCLFPWAVDYAEFGWQGFLAMGTFLAIFSIGYLWAVRHMELQGPATDAARFAIASGHQTGDEHG